MSHSDAKQKYAQLPAARRRVKPDWTFAGCSIHGADIAEDRDARGLIQRDADRWVVSATAMPKDVSDYHGDHAWLLVRYMFLMTPDENSRLLSASPAAPAPAASAPQNNSKTNGQTGWYRPDKKKAGEPLAFGRMKARAPG